MTLLQQLSIYKNYSWSFCEMKQHCREDITSGIIIIYYNNNNELILQVFYNYNMLPPKFCLKAFVFESTTPPPNPSPPPNTQQL